MKTIRNDQLLLYAVTDRHWLQGETLYDQVKKALDGGVTMVQLREKNLDQERFLEEAFQMKELCSAYQVPLLINDNVGIAAACDADGVHVGQSDMEAQKVRDLLGPQKIIGVSCKTANQARIAAQMGADYLGVGAMFPTGTKTDTSVLKLEDLRSVCEAVSIPVVAIGGITEENMSLLKNTGISGIALVSAIFGQPDIQEAAKRLKEKAQALFD